MVSAATDTPDWQGGVIASASASPITIGYQINAATTQTLIPGVAGQSIMLLWGTFVFNDVSGTTIFIEGTDGTPVFTYTCVATRAVGHNFNGIKLAAGVGLRVHNSGLANMAKPDQLNLIFQQS